MYARVEGGIYDSSSKIQISETNNDQIDLNLSYSKESVNKL